MKGIGIETFEKLTGQKITTFVPGWSNPEEYLEEIQTKGTNFKDMAKRTCCDYHVENHQLRLSRFVKYFAICENGMVLPDPEPDFFHYYQVEPSRKLMRKGIPLGIAWENHDIRCVVEDFVEANSNFDLREQRLTLHLLRKSDRKRMERIRTKQAKKVVAFIFKYAKEYEESRRVALQQE